MQSLEGLIIFIHVVEQKSFSSAAKMMKTSKANVSRQIARLEERLGVQLFQRNTRSVHLTEVGDTLYQSTKDNIYNLDETLCNIMKMQAIPRGTLRISTAGLFGETKVTHAAARYMQTYQDVKIELHFSDRNIDIINEGYDLAIRTGTLKDSALFAKRISSRRLILCASPNYLSQNGTPQTINELKNHLCLKSASSTWTFSDKRSKKLQYKVNANWVSNNARATLQACIQGLGIAQLPEYYVQDAINQGQLIPLLTEYEPADEGIWAVYSNKYHLSTKVRTFINLLIKEVN
ncbi:LysR family transcriptional regulator [Pasteurella atlantica]|uniref:LysR family transcriptional regulator n=2 Tax=Pasteurellaceae TaxID=712 RepID=A0ACC6HKK4_9PAST|nr:LysR family transcriptional regulator [Pasteurella atlantica]MDP8033581.1 LysR family transcriptional regulator [Pasteurella atlantica]MDP8035639.1 LysR family transcriptional regulator [Pasteurella atlantica]MDP8037590.1 LysR family transcriptional regulator [Pasteurella atlantica]MDP8047939.1 LysR family transcriptional regulator [Pasteurella atlantica]MDP8049894.1 LysR family transcriptional regulator [Pasteurella atlantica]